MKSSTHLFAGYRSPRDIIAHAVWLYHRFTLSFRDVEDLLAERDITMTYETIRQWGLTFDPEFSKTLQKRCPKKLSDLFSTALILNSYIKNKPVTFSCKSVPFF